MHFIAGTFIYLTHELEACAIQNRNLLPTLNAKDMQGVMRLTATEEKLCCSALLWRDVKAMHGMRKMD